MSVCSDESEIDELNHMRREARLTREQMIARQDDIHAWRAGISYVPAALGGAAARRSTFDNTPCKPADLEADTKRTRFAR